MVHINLLLPNAATQLSIKPCQFILTVQMGNHMTFVRVMVIELPIKGHDWLKFPNLN